MLRKIILFISRKRVFQNIQAIGNNPKVFGKNIAIHSPENIIIGNNLKINSNVTINGRGGVSIGDDVTLSDGCKILSTGYDLEEWQKNGKRVHKNEKVIIGDNVWICANAVICPGVTISGKKVVVAAGAVLTTDVTEDSCVVAGVPARVVKHFN